MKRRKINFSGQNNKLDILYKRCRVTGQRSRELQVPKMGHVVGGKQVANNIVPEAHRENTSIS